MIISGYVIIILEIILSSYYAVKKWDVSVKTRKLVKRITFSCLALTEDRLDHHHSEIFSADNVNMWSE